MPIELVWGTGDGPTELSAFDAALADAGIHNYNLVTLSSVIPDGESVEAVGTHDREWGVGELVAVVMAENTSTVPGETIAAGLGWSYAEEGGVFFEESAESAENVTSLLERGLGSARSLRDGWHWEDGIDTHVVEHTVEENGAVVVAAVYRPV